MSGNDVLIAQTLLLRDPAVQATCKGFSADGVYGSLSAAATSAFQSNQSLPATGTLDAATANVLLLLHSADNVKDDGRSAGEMGYLYKIVVPVHNNRSIETYATLYDKDNNKLLTFRTRQHGHRDDASSDPWPDFGNGDVGLTQFYSNGNTVTGKVELDLNSPEPDPSLYVLPNIRDGILLHTGDWTHASTGEHWTPNEDMPNSAGCMHAHPDDVELVYKILVDKLGVQVRANPFSGKNYPYTPQGVGFIQLID
eukprot:gene22449-30706_t